LSVYRANRAPTSGLYGFLLRVGPQFCIYNSGHCFRLCRFRPGKTSLRSGGLPAGYERVRHRIILGLASGLPLSGAVPAPGASPHPPVSGASPLLVGFPIRCCTRSALAQPLVARTGPCDPFPLIERFSSHVIQRLPLSGCDVSWIEHSTCGSPYGQVPNCRCSTSGPLAGIDPFGSRSEPARLTPILHIWNTLSGQHAGLAP
jgi:hypothetical protein